MNWKTLACLVVVAASVAGCSSSSRRSHSWASYKGSSEPVAGIERASYDRDWEDLRTGMTERQVRRELGSPRRVTNFRNGAENWYYNDGGVVYFNSRDRVADWRSPRYVYRTYRVERPVYYVDEPYYSRVRYDRDYYRYYSY